MGGLGWCRVEWSCKEDGLIFRVQQARCKFVRPTLDIGAAPVHPGTRWDRVKKRKNCCPKQKNPHDKLGTRNYRDPKLTTVPSTTRLRAPARLQQSRSASPAFTPRTAHSVVVDVGEERRRGGEDVVAVFSAHTTKIDPTRRNAYVLRLALVRTDRSVPTSHPRSDWRIARAIASWSGKGPSGGDGKEGLSR